MTTIAPTDAMDATSDHRSGAGPRRFVLGLAVVTFLGAALRIWYLVSSRINQEGIGNQGDAFWYSTTAQYLSDGLLFRAFYTRVPTAEHPPLTVVVLAPATFISSSTIAQRLTMVLIGTATIVLIGLIGRRVAGPVAGLAAAAIAALCPSLWINDVLVMSETVTAFVVTLVIGAGVLLAERPTTWRAVAAGGLCGVAALSRAETALLLPFVVWAVIAVSRRPWKDRLTMVAAATAATVLVVAPWTGFNLTRFEDPVLISTNDGVTLAGANCDTTYEGRLKGGWTIDPCVLAGYAEIEADKPPSSPGATFDCADSLQQRPPCLDPSQVSARLRARGIDHARTHLDQLPGVVVARNARVWGLAHTDQAIAAGAGEGRSRWASRLDLASVWVLLPFAVSGLVLLRRRGTSLAPFLGPLAVVILITSAVTGLTPRYRLPWDVASCILAGVAVGALIDIVRGRRPSLRRVPAGPDATTSGTTC